MTEPAIKSERARATVVRYIEIVLGNDAIEPVRDDIATNGGAEVIWELADTVNEVHPELVGDDADDERWDVAHDALRILTDLLITN